MGRWGPWNGVHGSSWIICVPQLSQCSFQDAATKVLSEYGRPSLRSPPPSRGLCSAKLTWGAQKSEGNKLGRLRQVFNNVFNNRAKSSANPSMVGSHPCWSQRILPIWDKSVMMEVVERIRAPMPVLKPRKWTHTLHSFHLCLENKTLPRTWNFQGAVQGCRVCWQSWQAEAGGTGPAGDKVTTPCLHGNLSVLLGFQLPVFCLFSKILSLPINSESVSTLSVHLFWYHLQP